MYDKCNTCLAPERLLKPVKYLGLNPDILKLFRLDRSVVICWECKARFRNIDKFRTQVENVQSILNIQLKVKKTCSNLNTIMSKGFDYEFKYEIEKEQASIPQMKIEYLDEEYLGEAADEAKEDVDEEKRGGKVEYLDEEVNEANDEYLDEPKNELMYEVMIEPQPNDEENSEDTDTSEDEELTEQEDESSDERYTIRIMEVAELIRLRKRDMSDPKYKMCPYKCELCAVGMWKAEAFGEHMTRYHFEGEGYTCEVCESKFLNLDKCNRHMESHYFSYRCNLCEFDTHRMGHFNRHYNKMHAQRYVCMVCNRKFHTLLKLQYHRTRRHGPFPQCHICKEVFTTFALLKEHMISHNSSIKCEFCDKTYKSRSALRTHVRALHKPPSPEEDAYCTECDYQFDSVAKYKLHLNNNPRHNNSGGYKCEQCNKTFIKKSNFQRHVNWMHLKRHAHHCHMCDKVFDRPERLNKHIQYNHEGVVKERKYVCEFCDKRFYELNTLKSHVLIHTGEKPFACEICDERFRQRAALRTHIRGVHKKIKRVRKKDIPADGDAT